MTRLEITDIFFIQKKGVAVTADIDDAFKDEFRIGRQIKIVRPDGTSIVSGIHGIEKIYTVSGQKRIGVLLDTVIVKEDVPRGSVMTIIDAQ